MLRKRKIKAIYQLEAYCNKCGSPMVSTGMVYSTFPEQYPYACTNKECDGRETFLAHERPGKFEYEFEEDDENV